MRRMQLEALVLSLVLLALAVSGVALAPATRATGAVAGPAQATGTPVPSPCEAIVDKLARPEQVRLGEEAIITLTAKVRCPVPPLHLVFVLPGSVNVPQEAEEDIRDDAERILDQLKLAENPEVQVGVVSYTASGHTQCNLTNDAQRARACLRQSSGTVGSAIDAGIDEALKVLKPGRPRDPAPQPREVMVVYAALDNATGCSPVISAASRAKSQKVLMVTNCAGETCDAACMRQVASSARYFFDVTGGGRGLEVSGGLAPATVKRLTITDRLPPDMAYVPDSAQPPPDKGDPVSGLVWQVNYVPADGLTITLRVRPLELGRRPTNLEATGELLDSANVRRNFVFPVPMVDVIPAPATETPTPTTPTATPTHVCTPPPCPCGRLVGSGCALTCEPCTATPTRVPAAAYLPWASCSR